MTEQQKPAYVVVYGGNAEQGANSSEVDVFDLDAFSTETDYSADDIKAQLELALKIGAHDVVATFWELYQDKLSSDYEKEQDRHGELFEVVRLGIESNDASRMRNALKIVAHEFGIEYEGKAE